MNKKVITVYSDIDSATESDFFTAIYVTESIPNTV